MSLGARIKHMRLMRGYTQSQMAEKLNMTEANFSSYERDKSAPPSERLNQIASILNVSIDYLHGRTDNIQAHASLAAGGAASSTPLTAREERDIAKDLERMLSDLESNEALAFHGEPIDEESKELLRISLENSMRLAKQLAKQKFTPKKYQK